MDFQNYYFLSLLFLAFIEFTISKVTKKDIEKQLGINLSQAPSVTWRDWVNQNPQIPETARGCGRSPPCPNSKREKFGYDHCCSDNIDCDASKLLECRFSAEKCAKLCKCQFGYFPNKNRSACVARPKKELGERCTENDNCYAAFATCKNGKCQCQENFIRNGDICNPVEYYCPYETPRIVCEGKTCIPWPCEVNRQDAAPNTCPRGFECLTPELDLDLPRFITVSRNKAVEKSYCCPLLPRLKIEPQTKIFDDVCLFGKPPKGKYLYGSDNCPSGYEWFASPHGSSRHVCCPSPCLRSEVGWPIVEVINGKCYFFKDPFETMNLSDKILGTRS